MLELEGIEREIKQSFQESLDVISQKYDQTKPTVQGQGGRRPNNLLLHQAHKENKNIITLAHAISSPFRNFTVSCKLSISSFCMQLDLHSSHENPHKMA